MPSMRGSSPSWSIHADRVVRRGWTRSQAIAPAQWPGRQAAEHLDGQAMQQVGHARGIVPGIEDDQDVRGTVVPLPAGDQVLDHLADLDTGHLGGVVVLRSEADRVEQLAPGGAAGLQRGDERVRPARDHQVMVPAAAKGVTEQSFRAVRCVRPQPVAHSHGQHQPPVGRRGLGQRGQCPPKPPGIDTSPVESVVQRPVPATVLGQQRQTDGGRHRPVSTQQRIRQLEQFVTPSAQTRMEVIPEV